MENQVESLPKNQVKGLDNRDRITFTLKAQNEVNMSAVCNEYKWFKLDFNLHNS